MLTTFLYTRVAEIRKAELRNRLKEQKKVLAELHQLKQDGSALTSMAAEIQANDKAIEKLVKDIVGS